MACSGGYCANQCAVYACTTYVAPNGVWDYTKIGDSATSGTGKYVYECPTNTDNPFPSAAGSVVYNENLDSLGKSINDERVRRGAGTYTFDVITGSQEGADPGSGVPATNGIIYGDNAGQQEIMKQIQTSINSVWSSYVTYNIIDGNPITYAQINEAKTKIDTKRSECICNGDCGGNSPCTCYNNCGCNYS